MKYLIDFIALALLYVFYLFKKWKRKGKDVLIFNTLMYVYLSFPIRAVEESPSLLCPVLPAPFVYSAGFSMNR